MKRLFLILISLGLLHSLDAQQKQTYTPTIEPCACPVKPDSTFTTHCGYLLVPENRKKKNSRTIKLPYVLVEAKSKNKKKDPYFFTTGGPGGSSLRWTLGITKSSVIETRDCIALEQRGTNFAVPNLWSNELSDAIQESYRKNLDKDSMVLEGTKRYKKALLAKGIDLAGYNTDETVADIHDLLKLLHIDSVNLLGGSYSGGLMMAVLQKDPSRVRSLILDSPLPTFTPIDEDEPANFMEGLNYLFRTCEKDSANQQLYGNLKEKFLTYFNSIVDKTFSIPYVEKNKTDTLHIEYTKNELLQVVVNTMYDRPRIKDVPYVVTEIIAGHHEAYVKDLLDNIFRGYGPSGMRISVYCADQTAYHSEEVLDQLHRVYPFLKGFRINDVYREMCDCWQSPPISPVTKQHFYSDKPALLSDGIMDPACSPLYIDQIHHYMPNSQRLLFTKLSHMTLSKDVMDLVQQFLDNPFGRLVSDRPDVIVY
ncbi:MAG: alpha/beta fold hydrolase [Chitinophagaceae bacterium]